MQELSPRNKVNLELSSDNHSIFYFRSKNSGSNCWSSCRVVENLNSLTLRRIAKWTYLLLMLLLHGLLHRLLHWLLNRLLNRLLQGLLTKGLLIEQMRHGN